MSRIPMINLTFDMLDITSCEGPDTNAPLSLVFVQLDSRLAAGAGCFVATSIPDRPPVCHELAQRQKEMRV